MYQVVTWTTGKSSLHHKARMTIQKMCSWGHPGLHYNSSKALLFLYLCLEMSMVLWNMSLATMWQPPYTTKENLVQWIIYLFSFWFCIPKSTLFLWVHDVLAKYFMTLSMLGKEGNICVPSKVSSFAEQLVIRCAILYACVTMVLDSSGPIIQFKSMSLKQKQTA